MLFVISSVYILKIINEKNIFYLERAMASVSQNTDKTILSDDDLKTSPVTPLPIYQQRDNFFC